MASFRHWRGEDHTLFFQPEQDDGGTPDLQDIALELRFSLKAACLTVPARPVADGFEVAIDEIDLSPGIYTAEIWITVRGRSSHAGNIHISFEDNC